MNHPFQSKIKIFADGADYQSMLQFYEKKAVDGFTTNPSLMRKAGVTHYAEFAKKLVSKIPNMPLSFEVFSDHLEEMEREARIIAQWGSNVYVKIPVTNTKGEGTYPLIKKLSQEKIPLNITALFTFDQVRAVMNALDVQCPALISVFAGRIGDTGVDPLPLMKDCARLLKDWPKAELLWASTREMLNITHAIQASCHVITVPDDLLKKMSIVGKNLEAYSLETVKSFYQDAKACGYEL